MKYTDYLIVGQGLAGSILAWELLHLNRKVLIVDPGFTISASKIAAGLINPYMGKRLTKDSDFDKQWSTALEYYNTIKQSLGFQVLSIRDQIRVITSQDQIKYWEKQKKTLPKKKAFKLLFVKYMFVATLVFSLLFFLLFEDKFLL